MEPLRVVAFGGGTGLSRLLRGLKRLPWQVTAVVTTMDSGGSTGRLRDELGLPGLGDVRRCLVALAPDEKAEALLGRLFAYRFPRGKTLGDHSLGNLILAALADLAGGVGEGVEAAGRLLGTRGRVLPVTTEPVHLWALLEDGSRIDGEARIDRRALAGPGQPRIVQIGLTAPAPAYPPVLEAIREADLLLFGPGDLYTSVLPNLLVEGVREAVACARGYRVMVTNLMTKPGETDGFAASDFLRVLLRYLGLPSLDGAVVHRGPYPEDLLRRYRAEGQEPVRPDLEECRSLARVVVARPLLGAGQPYLHHDPEALARAVEEVWRALSDLKP